MILPGHSAGRERGGAIVAAIAAFAAFVLIQDNNAAVGSAFNADSHYLILLVGDVVRGGSLADWYFAPHLYLFPDSLLTLGVVAGQGIGLAPLTCTTAFFGAAWVATGALLWRYWTGDGLPRATAWAGIVAGLAFALASVAFGPENVLGGQLVPGRHAGASILSPLCFLAASRLAAPGVWQRADRLLLTGLSVAIALAVFSDTIFVVWGVVPMMVVLLSQWRRVPRSRLLTIGGLAAAGAAIGYLVSLWAGGAVGERYFWREIQNWGTSASDAISYFWRAAIFTEAPLRSAIFYANVLLWIVAIRAFRKEWRRPESAPRNLLLIFMAAAGAAAVTITVMAGLFTPQTLRLFLPYLVWGYALLVAAIPAALARTRYANAALAAGLVLVFAVGGWFQATARPLRADLLAACLSARHLDSGAASFWDALPVMDETRRRIHLVSLSPTDRDAMVPFRWMFKRQWLSRRATTGATALLQFVVVSDTGPTEAVVTRAMGVPSGRAVCENRTVLLFDPPRPLPGAGE